MSLSNEQLVSLVQSGHRGYMAELWLQNRGMACRIARKYVPGDGSTHRISVEDNLQMAFIGLVKAADSYDATRGYLFITYAARVMRSAIRRGNRLEGRRYADHDAVSLDEAVAGEYEDLTRLDMLADDNAVDPTEYAVQEDTRQVVRETVEALPEGLDRKILLEYYWQGRQFSDIAKNVGRPPHSITNRHILILRTLRRKPALRHLEYRTRYHRHKGYRAFNSSFSSVVEDVVLWREQELEREDVRKI